MNARWISRWSEAAIAATAVVLSAGFARAGDAGGHWSDTAAPSRGDGSSCAACCQGAQEGARRSTQGMSHETPAAGDSFAVKGEISAVSPSRGFVVVAVPELGRSLSLQVNDRSQLFVNGDRVSLASLPAGAEVSATYVLRGDQFVVQQVNARTPDAEPAAGAGVGQGTNASEWSSEWNRSVDRRDTTPTERPRGTLKNSDVDDRDMPGESLSVTHSTDYDAGG